jgi:hypothetical protein
MTFDPTKPFQTRDGRKARIICTDLKDSDGETIVALISFDDNHEEPGVYYADGRYYRHKESPDDLVNVPETESRWANVYTNGSPGYASREIADHAARSGRLAVVELRIIDGKLVDCISHEV